jgi:hypothetical protein
MLQGYYLPQHMMDGLNDYFAYDHIENDVLRAIQTALSTVKIGKTVGSIGTQVRNFLSAIPVMGVNGSIYNLKGIRSATGVIAEQLSGKGASDYYKMLAKNGVVLDGAATGTIRDIARDVNIIDQGGFLSSTPNSVTDLTEGPGLFKTLTRTAFKTYQASDDFPKIVGFETYRNLLSEAYGLNRDDPRVIEESAQRVRDTYFTYSKVAKVIKRARSLPFGPPFISFPAEVYRTSKNFFKYIGQDLDSGNPVLQRNAGFRLVSAAATMGVMYNLGEIVSQVIFGQDEEEDTQFKLMNELMKNQKFTAGQDIQTVRKLDDGRFEAINMSKYNPYAGLTDVIGDFLNSDRDLDEKLWSSIKRLMAPFYQPDVTASVLNDAMVKYQNTPGTDLDKTAVFLREVAKGVLPTTVNEAVRTYKAYNGDLYNIDESKVSGEKALARAFGVTTDVVDPLIINSFKLRQLNDEIRLASNSLRFSTTGRNQPQLSPESLNNQLGVVNRLWSQALKDVDILRRLGYSDDQILKSMIAGKSGSKGPLSKEFASAIIEGRPFSGITPPSEAIQNQVDRVKFYRGDDAAKEIERKMVETYNNITQ